MRIGYLRMAALGCLASFALGNAAQAADLPPLETSDWTFTGAAYLWGSGIDGSIGVLGLPPQDVDLSFSDILEDLNMAVMAAGEARNGRFSLGFDVAYALMQSKDETPFGVLAREIDQTTSTLMATAVAGYSLLETDTARIDAIAGARLWSVGLDLDLNGSALPRQHFSDGETWVDPLVGAKFRADLGSDFYVSGWGMIGGFGMSSDLMWDVMAGLGYEFTDSFSVFGGYRAVSVDYSNGGFVYDVVQHGPLFAGVFRF